MWTAGNAARRAVTGAVLLLGAAGLAGTTFLRRALIDTCRGNFALATRIHVAWIGVYAFVGGEVAWALRPFIGSVYLLWLAFRAGAPASVLGRMVVNVGFDVLFGAILALGSLATDPTLSSASAELPADPALGVRVALAKSQNEPCTSAPGLKDRAACRADIGCDQKERCIVRFPMIPPVSNTLCEMAEEEVTLN